VFSGLRVAVAICGVSSVSDTYLLYYKCIWCIAVVLRCFCPDLVLRVYLDAHNRYWTRMHRISDTNLKVRFIVFRRNSCMCISRYFSSIRGIRCVSSVSRTCVDECVSLHFEVLLGFVSRRISTVSCCIHCIHCIPVLYLGVRLVVFRCIPQDCI
jgi:hypothetical protein